MSAPTEVRLRPQSLTPLILHLTGSLPAPGDAGSPAPWGPVIRQAQERLRHLAGPQPEPWSLAALNPQPLPPLRAAAALSSALIDQVGALQMLAGALPSELGQGVHTHLGALITRFVDDCGNGHLVIELPGVRPPGEPRPLGPEALVVIGAHLLDAAALHPAFGDAGLQLVALGLERLP